MIYQYHIVNLQYRVTTTTSVYSPRVIDYQSVTICIPLSIVINVTCLNQETSSDYTQNISDESMSNIMTTTTAYTLLKCAPTGHDIIVVYTYAVSNR